MCEPTTTNSVSREPQRHSICPTGTSPRPLATGVDLRELLEFGQAGRRLWLAV